MKVILVGICFVVSQLILCLNIYSANDSIKLSFSHERGYYDSTFVLSINVLDPAADIFYTTDCSDPLSDSGKIYTSGIIVDSTCIVKAVALTDFDTSKMITHTYLFPELVKLQPKKPVGYPETWGGSSTIDADYEMDPEVIDNPDYSGDIVKALKSLPSLSLTMDKQDWFDPENGVFIGYPNSDITHEKPVSAELIYNDPDKSFLVNCGVQNQGGTSIVNWKVPKQSMRLLFKDRYGPKKLNKKIFPDSDIESINTLVVDGFLYSWVHPWDNTQRNTALYFRDQLASNMLNQMGGLSFHGIYVNVYINGLYWGVYDLHERPDEDFMAEYYDAETEDFDIIKHNPKTIVSGFNNSYNELLEQARKGFSNHQALEDIKKYLDLPAFIDYMILNYYLGNFDWAHQNYYAATNKLEQTGFRFYTWDAEHVMRYSDVDYNCTDRIDIGGPTEIHHLLRKNAEYRMMFADAYYKHAFNNGALAPANFEKEFLKLKNEVELAMILESARWGDYLENTTGKVYTKLDHWDPEVDKVLQDYIPNRLDIVTRQLRASENLLFPRVMPPVFDKEEGEIPNGESIELVNSNITSGEIYYTLDGSDPRAIGGGIHGKLYSESITIENGTFIKARFRRASNNEWSALAEGYFIPESSSGSVLISEIFYNAGTNKLEFIELLNKGTSKADLMGCSFTDGIDFTFSKSTVLEPGQRIVLSNSNVLFLSKYGFEPYGIYEKRLSNSGETLLLSNFIGQTIDSVTYSDTIPWPYEADGRGSSLELVNVDSDNALAVNWKASDNTFGSPEEYIPVSVPFSQMKGQPELLVYPNPFKETVFIQLDNISNGRDLNIAIYNNLGQLVKAFPVTGNRSEVSINLSDLQAGIYSIQLLGSGMNERMASKMIVKLK